MDFFSRDMSSKQKVVESLSFQAGAFVGIVGARLGFNVAEFGEFILGWFGLDILGDDVHPAEKEQLPVDAPTSASE